MDSKIQPVLYRFICKNIINPTFSTWGMDYLGRVCPLFSARCHNQDAIGI